MLRSRTLSKVMVLRRYGSSPGLLPRDSALATFSATTRRRVPCARMPEAEILRELIRSMVGLHSALQGHIRLGSPSARRNIFRFLCYKLVARWYCTWVSEPFLVRSSITPDRQSTRREKSG